MARPVRFMDPISMNTRICYMVYNTVALGVGETANRINMARCHMPLHRTVQVNIRAGPCSFIRSVRKHFMFVIICAVLGTTGHLLQMAPAIPGNQFIA
jgi:hypothetical protein